MRQTRIPSDVDREDRIMAGLSARQLAIVVAPLAVLWLVYLLLRAVVPVFAFIPVAVVVGAIGFTLAVGERDGLSLDRLAFASLRYHRSAKRLLPESPIHENALDLPVQDIDENGILDLGDHGAAIVCRASSVSFTLLAEVEQEGASAAFGRLCNALGDEIQITIRSTRVDLSETLKDLEHKATGLPHLRLEKAATGHASFLAAISTRSDLWMRQSFVVFRSKCSAIDAPPILHRRVEEAVSLLRSSGVQLVPLCDQEVEMLLRTSTDPNQTPIAGSSVFNRLVTGDNA